MPKSKAALQGKVIYVPDVQKPLPASIDAEKGVLGSCLLSPDKVIPMLLEAETDQSIFHHPAHGRIWESLIEMRSQSLPIDLVTLTSHMENQKLLIEVGGPAVIAELFTFVPTSSNVMYYLEILKEKKVLRDLIYAGTEYAHRAYEEQGEAEILSAEALAAFTKISLITVRPEKKDHDKEDYTAFLDEMEGLATGTRKPDLLPTFIPKLDQEVGGMARGEMYVIQGQTSTGKSLALQQMVQDNVMLGGRNGDIYSMEMMFNQYMRRMVARHGSVSLSSMREGRFTKNELASFSNSMALMRDWKCSIHTPKRNQMTPQSIEASIRRQKKNKGCDIVAIDYLQLMKFSPSEKRRDQELQQFSSTIKQMAIELDFVVILAAQANKDGSVFDASQVESDADGVLSMVPEYEMVSGQRKVVGTKGIFVQKFREGRRGWTIKCSMEGKYARLNYD